MLDGNLESVPMNKEKNLTFWFLKCDLVVNKQKKTFFLTDTFVC